VSERARGGAQDVHAPRVGPPFTVD
jgi:hypothetical protein